jgi:hypothetical protein
MAAARTAKDKASFMGAHANAVRKMQGGAGALGVRQLAAALGIAAAYCRWVGGV